MKNRAFSAAVITPLLLCQCHTGTPAARTDAEIDDPTPAASLKAPQRLMGTCMNLLNNSYVALTAEETEDLHKLLHPLCHAQEPINVYYHGIQYKGDKPLVYLLGTLKAEDFILLASATQAVTYGEVIDDFERYTFRTPQGEKVEAYISQSNRNYGIELTGAPAVYAPIFHDRIMAMRSNLVLPPAGSTAKNAQH
ncbi:MAG: hypothetical protein IJA81_04925 [Akkermansia sp.]|nr:hypothetical protein [Akkermansia sp.]